MNPWRRFISSIISKEEEVKGMAQLGLVIQKDQVKYLYAEAGTIVFSQSNGDFVEWIDTCGISFATIDSVVVQRDFCEELPRIQAKGGQYRLEFEDFVREKLFDSNEKSKISLEEMRQKQLAEFDVEDVVTPDVELIRNQITRENYWVVNLMLHERAKEFVNDLEEKQKQFGIKVPVYFLTGSGFLTDAKNILRNPVLTWRSAEALELLSAARHHHLKDFIYVKKQAEEYSLAVIKDGEPIDYQNRCSFNGYELPPWFVKISRSKASDLENAITFLKRFHGDLPMVVEGEFVNKQIEYSRYASIRNPMGGLFQIPYRKRLFRQINMAQGKVTDQIEEEIRRAMDKYLIRNEIVLKDPTYTLSSENWQYSLERIARLELRVVGEL
jgi:hypothetical protein